MKFVSLWLLVLGSHSNIFTFLQALQVTSEAFVVSRVSSVLLREHKVSDDV